MGARILFLLLALLGTAAAAQPTSWRIQHFEVVQAQPWAPDSYLSNFLRSNPFIDPADIERLLDPTDTPFPLTQDVKKTAEEHLHQTALLLMEWGFPEPSLQDIVTRPDGTKAFRVYFTNLEDNVAGLYEGTFSGSLPSFWFGVLPALYLDADAIATVTEIKPHGYLTLSHELVHATQFATPFFMRTDLERYGDRIRTSLDYELNPWLAEGMADAVAADVVRRLHPEIFNKVSYVKGWGLRNYSRDLVVRDEGGSTPPKAAYQTSSFWRYLAEVYHFDKHPTDPEAVGPGIAPLAPGPYANEVDYSYMPRLLSRTIRIENETDEILWLDTVIKQEPGFKLNLRDYFSDFLVVYGEYGGRRVAQTYGYEFYDWLKGGFRQYRPGDAPPPQPGIGDLVLDKLNDLNPLAKKKPPSKPETGLGCHRIELGPQLRRVAVPLRLQRNSGACIRVGVEAFGGEVPASVTLSALDKERLSQLRIGISGQHRTAKTTFTKGDDGTTRTLHNFRLRADDDNVFVISNMSSQPHRTTGQIASVIFTVGGVVIDGEGDAGGGSDAAPADAVDQTPDKSTRDRATRAASRISRNGPNAAMIDRNDRRGEIEIRLGAVPDALNVLTEVNLSGTIAGMMRGGDTARQELMARRAEMMEAARAAAQEDQLLLKIPLVDYGFEGLISGAEIRLSRYQDIDLHALDPDSREPNGTVTIDEYGPEMMRGSFSAILVAKDEKTDRGTRAIPRDQALPVVREISGRFWVAAPWLTDERTEIEPSDTLADDVGNDIKQWMPGLFAPVIDAAIEQAKREQAAEQTERRARKEAEAKARAERLEASCSCACDRQLEEAYAPGCATRCAPAWAQCAGAATGETLDGQLAELERLMAGSGLPEAQRRLLLEQMRSAFEDMPPNLRGQFMDMQRQAFGK